jgi:outer membrane protein insertion porin family
MIYKTSRNTLAMVFPRVIRLFSFFVIIIAFADALAQQPSRKIGKIEIDGLVKLSADEVVAISGLKTGELFAVESLDAAGQKLFDSGLFAKVSYRTTTKGDQVAIVFQVEETKGGASQVVFDNFVWFTNDDLVAAIRRAVPSFNGIAPDSGNMTETIRVALQNLLKEHHIDGVVEYAPWQSRFTGSKQEHLFSVAGVPIPICRLHFPGAKNIPEERLLRSSRQLIEADYSQKAAIAFSYFTLLPIYREAGQLRATFADPLPKYADGADCKGGVELTLPVEEGPIFLWNKAEWTGNESLAPQELDTALGMKNGELANGVKIDKGLNEVSRKYSHTGRLDVSFGMQPEFDDKASQVTFKIAVNEGPQYRMGTLTFKGLTDDDAKSLQERWKLKSGDVFDGGYFERFLKSDARDEIQRISSERQAARKSPVGTSVEVTPNRKTLTADVTIEFKN